MIPAIELWVEGVTDAREARPRTDARPALPAGGALATLVRRVLGAEGGLDDAAIERLLPEAAVTVRPINERLKGVTNLSGDSKRGYSKKGWKVLAAISKALKSQRGAVIIAVWDSDGEDEPLADRDKIHGKLREWGTFGVACGVCVEEVEAWLLADAGAFKKAFARGPERGLPGAPELERDPKATLDRLLRGIQGTDDRVLVYDKLARHIDLEMLGHACPRGFGAFRRALVELVLPVVPLKTSR